MKRLVIFFIFMFQFLHALGQGNQSSSLDQQEHETKPIYGTFNGTRIINGQSIEMRSQGNLDVIISHRFGSLNSGGYNLFGLDDSNVRLGLEYSIWDWFTVGIGRNSLNKVYDGFLKARFKRQEVNGFPISLVWVSDMSLYSLKRPELLMTFQRRLRYVHQLLISRKLTKGFSIQVMPSLVHKNLVEASTDSNTLGAIGLGGRIAFSDKVHLTGEYYYRIGSDLPGHNSLGIGVDIETGGHVFQLHFTNSNEMTPSGFIPETQGDFWNGDIHFGFNIVRSFELKKWYQ